MDERQDAIFHECCLMRVFKTWNIALSLKVFLGVTLLLEIIKTKEQDVAQDNKNIILVSVRLNNLLGNQSLYHC